MEFEKKIVLNSNQSCTLRNARFQDASDLIEFLKITAEETLFLIREPEEIALTIEQETSFIENKIKAQRELLMIARIDEKYAGSCSLSCLGNYMRYRHRCSIAIVLYQKYWGLGLGTEMLQTILEIAKDCNYEQAELEVVCSNEKAVGLYKKLGFEIYGIHKHSMKYKDGSYCDEYLMVKDLKSNY